MADISKEAISRINEEPKKEKSIFETHISPSFSSKKEDVKKEDGKFGSGYYLYMDAEDSISKARDFSSQKEAYITPTNLVYDNIYFDTIYLDLTQSIDYNQKITINNRIMFKDRLNSILDLNLGNLTRRFLNYRKIKGMDEDKFISPEDFIENLHNEFKLPGENKKNVLKRILNNGNYKGIIYNDQEDGNTVKKIFLFKKPELHNSISVNLNTQKTTQKEKEQNSENNSEQKVGTGANLDRLIELFGTNMYSDQLQNTTIKELFQNSFDSLKSAIKSGQIHEEKAEIGIMLDRSRKMVQVIDNGIGMSPQTVKEAFLTIAGTMKDELDFEDRSGGFGVAKLAFLFGSERLKLTTIKNGIKTTLDTSGKELLSQDATLKTEKTEEPNGTNIQAYLPDLLKDEKGKIKPLYFDENLDNISFFQNPLIGNIKVKDLKNDQYINPGENLDLDHFIPFGQMKANWGTIDILIHPKKNTISYNANHMVFSSGLYQFNTNLKKGVTREEQEKFPYNIILNIKPSVDASNKNYPFNKQRENWNPNIATDVKMIEAYIKAIDKRMEIEKTITKFGEIQRMPQKFERLPDLSFAEFNDHKELSNYLNKFMVKGLNPNETIVIENKTLKQNDTEVLRRDDTEYAFAITGPILGRENYLQHEIDDRRSLFHQNLSVDIISETIKRNPKITEHNVKEFLCDIGDVLKEYKDTLLQIPDYRTNFKNKKLAFGVSIDKKYDGVYIRTPLEGMFLNPISTKGENPPGAAACWTHTLIHESCHALQGNHNEGFTTAMGNLYRDFGSKFPGFLRQVENSLEEIAQKHWGTLEAMQEVYNDYQIMPANHKMKGITALFKEEDQSYLKKEIKEKTKKVVGLER